MYLCQIGGLEKVEGGIANIALAKRRKEGQKISFIKQLSSTAGSQMTLLETGVFLFSSKFPLDHYLNPKASTLPPLRDPALYVPTPFALALLPLPLFHVATTTLPPR